MIVNWDEDDCGDGDWGYEGDPEQDQSVDYTTDMYEGADSSGVNADCEDIGYAYEDELDCQAHQHHEIEQLEKKVLYLEGALAVAIGSLAEWEAKATSVSSPQSSAKIKRNIKEQKSKVDSCRKQLEEATWRLATIKERKPKNAGITIMCIAVIILALVFILFL